MLRLPNVYTILPGIPFAKALAAQLWAEYRDNLPALSDVQIYLPNRRSCRAVADTFLEISDGQATLLPRLTPLGDIDEDDLLESDPFILDEDPFLTPAIPMLERQIILTKLIQARPDIPMSVTEAFNLAGELASFLDRAHTEQIDLKKIDTLVTGDLAAHWKITRDFLAIIIHHWPDILASRNQADPAQRRNILFQKKIEALRNNPPKHRVIAAGSTGSILASAQLLDVISRLPNGAVILPGLDPSVDQKIWDAVDEMHPYFYQKRLVTEFMDIDRHSIKLWPGTEQRNEKQKLAQFALQPQAIFDLSDASLDMAKINNMDFIAAENPLHEAKIIALMLREALNEPESTAMVVTPDRILAQHIQQEMLRWDLLVNDSGGQKLNQSPVGVFMNIIAGFLNTSTPATHILSLMRHDLFRLHAPEERRLDATCLLEKDFRKKFLPQHSLKKFAEQNDHPILTETLEVLDGFLLGDARPLHEWLALHITCAEQMATTPNLPGTEILWKNEAGESCAQLFYKLHEAAMDHDFILSPQDYSSFIIAAMEKITIRPRFGTHPRIRILSPIEARLQDADRVILAGLNEGVWPAQVKADAWLSRPMQRDMGFGSPDRRIGQSALDFAVLFSLPHATMTWSKKRDGVAAHPSRWLQQIFAVLKKNDALPAIDASPYFHWARAWDEPETLHPQGAPSFSPPNNVRPRDMRVTAVETWQKDPYALYANRILDLVPGMALDRQPDARDWGNAAHKILEEFFRDNGFFQNNPAAFFNETANRILATYPLNKAQEKAWRGKLDVIRDWMLEHERAVGELHTEISMHTDFTLPDNTNFKLHGRADRIDIGKDGLTITDYKTGAPPSDKKIKKGQSPQMPLLGLLAQQHFKSGTPELRYIKLRGKVDNPAEARILKQPEELMQTAREVMDELLHRYYVKNDAYTAHALAKNDYDDYRHLKRVAEWAALDDGEDDFSEGEEA